LPAPGNKPSAGSELGKSRNGEAVSMALNAVIAVVMSAVVSSRLVSMASISDKPMSMVANALSQPSELSPTFPNVSETSCRKSLPSGV
jgi:hypothetical protein